MRAFFFGTTKQPNNKPKLNKSPSYTISGKEIQWKVASPAYTSTGTRYVADKASDQVAVNGPATINVSWDKQYRLIARVSPAAAGRIVRGHPEVAADSVLATAPDTAWLAAETEVELVPQAHTGYVFSEWKRDPDLTGTPQLAVLEMKGPKMVTGIFSSIPIIRLSNYNLAFDRVRMNEDRELELVVSNMGKEKLTVYRIESSNSDEFMVSSFPSSFSVPAGDSSAVAVKFTPATAGNKTATLILHHNPAPETEITQVAVSGEGIKHQKPKLDPKLLDFEIVDVGEIRAEELVVINRDSSVAIDVTGIEWTPPNHFEISPTSLQLPPMSSKSITVTFSPASAGPKEAKLILSYSAGSEPGTGLGKLKGEGNELDFSDILGTVATILGILAVVIPVVVKVVIPPIRKHLEKARAGARANEDGEQ